MVTVPPLDVGSGEGCEEILEETGREGGRGGRGGGRGRPPHRLFSGRIFLFQGAKCGMCFSRSVCCFIGLGDNGGKEIGLHRSCCRIPHGFAGESRVGTETEKKSAAVTHGLLDAAG